MRISCLALAIAVVAVPLSFSSADENDDARKAVAAKAEEFKRKLLAKFDLNGDGQVDNIEKSQVAEQIQKDIASGKMPEELKGILDLNGDGQVDPRELGMAREMMMRFQGGKAGGPPQFGAPGFGGPGGFDGGGLSNFGNQIPPEVMKKFDKNKDGELDEKEQKAAMAAMGPKKSRAQQLKEKMDLDGDGKITKEEREAYAEQRKAEQEEKKREKSKKKDDR